MNVKWCVRACCAAMCCLAALAPAVAGEDEAAAEEEAPKKRRPRKEKEYRDWDKVLAHAEAWEQPVIVLVTLSGDKKSNLVKQALFSRAELFKDVMQPNCLFYSVTVPKVREKRNNRGNSSGERPLPRPNWEAMRGKAGIARQACEKTGFPAVVLCSHTGRIVAPVSVASSGPVLGSFVEALKGAFSLGKYEFTVTPRLQKMLDREAKKVAAEQKRMMR